MNNVTLSGNLVTDVEVRDAGEHTVGNFRFAVRDQGDKTVFVDVNAWNKTATLANQYLKKGSFAMITGRLQQDQWEDKETGQKRSKILVTAHNIEFGPKGEEGKSENSKPVKEAAPANSGDDEFADF